jgi:pimeloyl-ACP methyl ester carboxylesterase
MLYSAKLATLLIDLLTPEEEQSDRQTKRLGCDMDRLVARLMGVTNWLLNNPTTQNLKIGYLDDSIGSPGALVAATFFQGTVRAIACYSGHIDLTGSALFHVRVPILLVVGGKDAPIVGINRRAMYYLRTKKQLVIIPNVTHLFEKPGSLEEVAQLASRWFGHYLAPADRQELDVQGANEQKAIGR